MYTSSTYVSMYVTIAIIVETKVYIANFIIEIVKQSQT